MTTTTMMDRIAAAGTTALLAALRAGGYDVQTPVTGSVIVDGQEIESAAWDRMVMEWDGSADGLEDMGWERAADAMRDDEEDGPMQATSLDDLLSRVQALPTDDDRDLTRLPTFGGEEPDSTHGVFSWDAGRLLVQDRTGWRIVARSERQ